MGIQYLSHINHLLLFLDLLKLFRQLLLLLLTQIEHKLCGSC